MLIYILYQDPNHPREYIKSSNIDDLLKDVTDLEAEGYVINDWVYENDYIGYTSYDPDDPPNDLPF